MKPKLVETLRRVRDLELARAEQARAEAEARRSQASEAVMRAQRGLEEFDKGWEVMLGRGVSPQQLRLADDERRRHIEAVAAARAEMVRAAERVSECQRAVAAAQAESKQHERVEERLAQQVRRDARRNEQKMLDSLGSRSHGED